MLPDTWIPHARSDGEVLGWMEQVGDAFRVRDRLGRVVADSVDWLAAEELLEALGIGFLGGRWLLTADDGTAHPVRVAEVTADTVTVVRDDFGAASAVGATPERIRLPFPAPPGLREA